MPIVTNVPKAKTKPKMILTQHVKLIIMHCEDCRFWRDGQCFRHALEGARFRLESDEARLYTDADFGCVQGEA